MAREKKIEVSALNIRLTSDSHTTEDYIDLFKDIVSLQINSKIASKEWGQILQFHEETSYVGEWSYYGDILRFTAIDGWFDLDRNDEASDKDVSRLVIPNNFRANGQRLSFIFFPEDHLFVFQTYSGKKRLGASHCLRMIQGMVNDDRIIEKYGLIEVTLVPDKDQLDKAFKINTLETLNLIINRPNPDGFAQTEQKILERMHALNVRSIERSYKSVKSESIDADDELRDEADVAARNGRVYIKGKDEEGHKKEFKTEEHPLRESTYYDEEVELETQAFANFSKNIKQKFVEWVQNVKA